MKLTVGITGGAGFIGSHIVDYLAEQGHKPVIFDRHKHKAIEADLMLGDVRNKTDVMELGAHVDAIIHLAAVLGTQETIADPWPATETNTLGMINVLDACRLYKIPLVYAGVGNFQMLNTYSTTKTAAERLLGQYRDNLGLRAATVRPMNAYGPRQKVAPPFGPAKVRKIAPAFICRALCNLPIEIYGDGSQVSDMVWVGDVARVFVDTLTHLADMKAPVPRYPIEVGPKESLTVLDVANAVQLICESTQPHVFLPMRPGEMTGGALPRAELEALKTHVESLGVDRSLVHQALRSLSSVVNADVGSLEQVGISPSSFTGLTDGLRKTIGWFKANKEVTWTEPAP